MTIAQNEILGPVMSVFRFKSDAEAIEKVNDSSYGLWSAVFTKCLHRSAIYSKELETGTVSVNCHRWTYSIPFGGFKESGFGREGGLEGLLEYSQTKVVNICPEL
jgi:acyl-CoA reductase-like NAD-dependent aldehyde dehydrogenase